MRKTLPPLALASFMAVAPAAYADTPPKPDHKPLNCKEEPFQTGTASVYADSFDGQLTANEETLSLEALTAAHKTLEFGTRVQVRDRKTGERVIVRINDRGPFVDGRVIDLTPAARNALGHNHDGLYRVSLHICS